MKFPIEQKFTLTENFIDKYKVIKPDFGFGGLGEFVFLRTYSRLKENGKNESWWETVRRVVEGIYSIQKQHIEDYNLGWNQMKAQKSAQEMYDRIFNFKMLGSGRSLWAMGSPVIMDKGLSASLYNCSFISTEKINENPGAIFSNIMDFLMLGVGVGSDLRGANKIIVKEQKEKENIYIISDDREGWIKSVELLINSFFGGERYSFDYSLIRKEGEPIKTFGGVSGGYKPLEKLHQKIKETLENNINKAITETSIANIINLIGQCVVSGNVRRSAEVLLGEPTEEFLNLKDYKINPDRKEFGWASNNSIFADIGMDFSFVADKTKNMGEPGYIFLENMQKYGRINDTEENWKDKRVMGGNPCLEITLENGELCNLVEIIPSNHLDIEDFKKTIKYAYLFAKTITLLNTHWPETNKVMLRNRRIGLSITGIATFLGNHNISELKEWMESGYNLAKDYDKIYSDWFAIPESIKISTIKPSGTLSLLAGVTPGLHFPQSNYYIRRVRIRKNMPIIDILKNSGYKIEPANEDTLGTVVVEFPVAIGDSIRTLKEVSMWEQLNLAAFCQKYWSDNAVSITVSFNENEGKQIKNALDYYQFKLKGVSFLPNSTNEIYPQMPYEEISKSEYEKAIKEIKPIDFSKMVGIDSENEKYCNNDVCIL